MGMPNGNAPGPNSFTIDIYKSCWPILKLEVHALMEESCIQKYVLKALKYTSLTLIHKGKFIESPDKFRPISLYNVIYKIISKVLTNRVKSILLLLISHQRSDYVEGRKILDNIIFSHELIHSLKSKEKPRMMIQLDMSKAFKKNQLGVYETSSGSVWVPQRQHQMDHGNGVGRIFLCPCEWFPFPTLQSFQGYETRRSYLSLHLCHHG